MTENTTTTVADTTSSRGAQWAGAGSLIAIAAQSLFGGGIGGLFGGNATAQAANTVAALEMAKKDAEIAQLKANAETDKKLVDVFTALRAQDKTQDQAIAALREETNLKFAAVRDDIHVLDKRVGEVSLVASNGITQLNGAVAALQSAVAGITKTVVPITSVCPQPMPQYNSWTAPNAAS